MDRSSMTHQYWDFMDDIRFQIIYDEKYEHHLQTICLLFDITAYLLSGTAVILWAIFGQHILVWTTMIALGQLIQILKPMFPFCQRAVSLRYYLPELRKLAVDTEKLWNAIPTLDDQAFLESMAVDKARAIALESNYIGSVTIPCVQKLSDQADQEKKSYMESFKPIPKEGGETDAE